MKNFCPNTPKCPIFNDGVLSGKTSQETYKNLYCLTAPERHTQCMRYKVKERFGSCPNFVMPNSSLSMGEIESKMKAQKGQMAQKTRP